MPRGLSAAKPDMISAIQTAIKQYVEGGTAKGASASALANALGQQIGEAVHAYVKSAQVIADLGMTTVPGPGFLPNPIADVPGVLNIPPGTVTRPGEGKLQ